MVDTRTGGEIQPGGMVTDHCGHSAKLVEITSPTTIRAEWLPDGLTGEYPALEMFSLRIEREK